MFLRMILIRSSAIKTVLYLTADFFLFEQDHLFRTNKINSLNSIEINSAGQTFIIELKSVIQR